jgi:ABC-type transport system involved in cytochrome c biogenesis permease subunit
MKTQKLFAWLPGLIALIAVLLTLLPPGRVRGFDMAGFGRLPVLQGGRVKPLGSVARNSLLLIRGKQSAYVEGRTLGPDEWILDVLFRPAVADTQDIFVINDPDVLGLMGIQQSSNRYFSFATLAPHLAAIEQQAQAAMNLDATKRSRFQGAVLELYNRLVVYHQLANTLQLNDGTGLQAEFQAAAAPANEARHKELDRQAYFRMLAPLASQDADAWLTVGEGLDHVAKGAAHPALEPLGRAGTTYAAGNPQAFNQATAALRDFSVSQRPGAVAQASHEFLFNQAEPFYLGMWIYGLALLVVFISWAWKTELLQPAALSLLGAGLIVHTTGLISRILLQGRPPVTNLYSSAIFVGWVTVVLGVILERMYRRGFATAVAGAAGFASLIVAQHLAGGEDTMEMMRAVLDSNFWLATHVVTITIGYGGTFLAGSLAIAYTLRKHLVPNPDEQTSQALLDTTYGILCFSLLFSFVGTVLGGIWADQSWGRFWGWDPKENGALLIVLWNALILHARWGKYIQGRGLMAMAIVGNIITSLAWFGVNMLGVGLHSYGFTDGGFLALSAFVGSQLLLMGLCLLPGKFWVMAKIQKK